MQSDLRGDVVFERPPVTEVACGIVFEPLDKLLAPHLGQLWEVYRTEYPGCEEKAILINAGEPFNFGEVPPLPRIWFKEADENRIIQIQRDRFYHNWRETPSSNVYPRYDAIRNGYKSALQKFVDFLGASGLGVLKPRSAEIVYVNELPVGNSEYMQSFENIKDAFPMFNPNLLGDKCQAEGFNWLTIFPLPDARGRLQATVRSKIKEGKPLIGFELTARKSEGEFELRELWDWFDMAHREILTIFTRLTSREVQDKVWGRHDS